MGTRKLALTCLSPLTSGCYFDRLGIGLRRREVISGFHWLSFFSGPGKWLRQGVFVEDSVDSFRFSLLGPFLLLLGRESLGIPSSAPTHWAYPQCLSAEVSPSLEAYHSGPMMSSCPLSLLGRTHMVHRESCIPLEVQAYPKAAARLSSHQAAAFFSASAVPGQASDLSLQPS